MAGASLPLPASASSAPALVPAGKHAGKPSFKLERPVIEVGSRKHCRLHLLSESVSKAHALIVRTSAGVYVRDLASRTHLYVNSQKVREIDLHEGDLIAIGNFSFKFRPARSNGSTFTEPAPLSQLVIVGDSEGIHFVGRVMLIGHREGCDVILADPSVSTCHAVILELDGQYVIRDLGSRTGTFLNGKAVHQEILSPGDLLGIGTSTLRFEQVEPPASHATAAIDDIVDEPAEDQAISSGAIAMLPENGGIGATHDLTPTAELDDPSNPNSSDDEPAVIATDADLIRIDTGSGMGNVHPSDTVHLAPAPVLGPPGMPTLRVSDENAPSPSDAVSKRVMIDADIRMDSLTSSGTANALQAEVDQALAKPTTSPAMRAEPARPVIADDFPAFRNYSPAADLPHDEPGTLPELTVRTGWRSQRTPAPIDFDESLDAAEDLQSPVDEPLDAVEVSQSPVVEALTPAVDAESPFDEPLDAVEVSQSPVDEALTPVVDAPSPVDEALTAAIDAESPVDESLDAAKDLRPPVDEPVNPVADLQSPVGLHREISAAPDLTPASDTALPADDQESVMSDNAGHVSDTKEPIAPASQEPEATAAPAVEASIALPELPADQNVAPVDEPIAQSEPVEGTLPVGEPIAQAEPIEESSRVDEPIAEAAQVADTPPVDEDALDFAQDASPADEDAGPITQDASPAEQRSPDQTETIAPPAYSEDGVIGETTPPAEGSITTNVEDFSGVETTTVAADANLDEVELAFADESAHTESSEAAHIDDAPAKPLDLGAIDLSRLSDDSAVSRATIEIDDSIESSDDPLSTSESSFTVFHSVPDLELPLSSITSKEDEAHLDALDSSRPLIVEDAFDFVIPTPYGHASDEASVIDPPPTPDAPAPDEAPVVDLTPTPDAPAPDESPVVDLSPTLEVHALDEASVLDRIPTHDAHVPIETSVIDLPTVAADIPEPREEIRQPAHDEPARRPRVKIQKAMRWRAAKHDVEAEVDTISQAEGAEPSEVIPQLDATPEAHVDQVVLPDSSVIEPQETPGPVVETLAETEPSLSTSEAFHATSNIEILESADASVDIAQELEEIVGIDPDSELKLPDPASLSDTSLGRSLEQLGGDEAGTIVEAPAVTPEPASSSPSSSSVMDVRDVETTPVAESSSVSTGEASATVLAPDSHAHVSDASILSLEDELFAPEAENDASPLPTRSVDPGAPQPTDESALVLDDVTNLDSSHHDAGGATPNESEKIKEIEAVEPATIIETVEVQSDTTVAFVARDEVQLPSLRSPENSAPQECDSGDLLLPPDDLELDPHALGRSIQTLAGEQINHLGGMPLDLEERAFGRAAVSFDDRVNTPLPAIDDAPLVTSAQELAMRRLIDGDAPIPAPRRQAGIITDEGDIVPVGIEDDTQTRPASPARSVAPAAETFPLPSVLLADELSLDEEQSLPASESNSIPEGEAQADSNDLELEEVAPAEATNDSELSLDTEAELALDTEAAPEIFATSNIEQISENELDIAEEPLDETIGEDRDSGLLIDEQALDDLTEDEQPVDERTEDKQPVDEDPEYAQTPDNPDDAGGLEAEASRVLPAAEPPPVPLGNSLSGALIVPKSVSENIPPFDRAKSSGRGSKMDGLLAGGRQADVFAEHSRPAPTDPFGAKNPELPPSQFHIPEALAGKKHSSSNGETHGKNGNGKAGKGNAGDPPARGRGGAAAWPSEAARESLPRQGRPARRRVSIPAILALMFLAMGSGVAVVWFLVPPTVKVEASFGYKNLSGPAVTQAYRVQYRASKESTLRQDPTRELAIRLLPKGVAPGFLGDTISLSRAANTVHWPDARPDTMLVVIDGTDRVYDIERMSALLKALYEIEKKESADAQELAKLVTQTEASVREATRNFDQLRQDVERLHVDAQARPSAERLAELEAKANKAETEWRLAQEKVGTLAAEIKRLATANEGDDANAPAQDVDKDSQIDQMQKDLAELQVKMDTARTQSTSQAEAARKTLDDAIAQVERQIEALQAGIHDSPELQAYLQAAQDLQKTTRELTSEFIRNQQSQFRRLSEYKERLEDQLASKREEIYANDPQLKELTQEHQYALRSLNAAKSTGLDKDADLLTAQVNLLETQIRARKTQLGEDQFYKNAIADTQRIIDATHSDMQKSRERFEQVLEALQKQFQGSAPAVEKLPAEQKALASALKKRLDEMTAARKQYADAAESANPQANEQVMALEEASAALLAKVEQRKVEIAQSALRTESERARIARQLDLESRQKELTEARALDKRAGAAVFAAGRELRSAQASLEEARSAAERVEALESQRDNAQKEMNQREKNLKMYQAQLAQAIEPTGMIGTPSARIDDPRPVYIIAVVFAVLVFFSVMILMNLRATPIAQPITGSDPDDDMRPSSHSEDDEDRQAMVA